MKEPSSGGVGGVGGGNFEKCATALTRRGGRKEKLRVRTLGRVRCGTCARVRMHMERCIQGLTRCPRKHISAFCSCSDSLTTFYLRDEDDGMFWNSSSHNYRRDEE